MAQFTVSIPGIGDVIIDGPFATEDSIRTLTNAISRSRNTGGGRRDDDDLDDIFDDLIGASDNASDAMDRLIRQTNRSKESFGKLSNGLDRSVNGLKNLVAGSHEVNGGFSKMIDSFGDGTSSLLSKFPVIGTVAGGVITAFTGLISAAIGFVDGLRDTNTSLMSVGALFKNGIDDFQIAARDGSVAMSALTKSVTENYESYRFLSGGLIGGTKTISKAFKTMGTEQQRMLYSMGYSTDEILSGMADFGAMAKLSGKNLSLEELAQGGADYLKVQRELTRLSGKTAQQLKAEREGLRSQTEFMAFLNRVGDPKLREAVENGMLMIPDAAKELVHSMTMNNPFTKPEYANVMAAFPELEAEFRYLGKAARDGTIESEEYTRRYNKALAALVQGSNKYLADKTDAEVEMIAAQRRANGTVDAIYEIFGSLAGASIQTTEAMSASNEAMNKITGPGGALAQAIGVFNQFDNDISSLLNNVGAAMTKFFLPEGEFVKIMNNLIAFGNKVSAALDEYASDPNATISQLWDKVYTEFKTQFGEIYNISTGILSDWLQYFGEKLSDAIAKGIKTGYELITPWTDEGEETAQVKNYLKGDVGTSVEEVTRPKMSWDEEFGFTALDEQKQKQWDLYKKLYSLNEKQLAELNYIKESDKSTGGFKFISKNQTVLEPSVRGQLNNIRKNALGNMYEPKQGGHIIRVAEALTPEIVAPAKRTSDGKLGLEVSGVMLDNSRLLQNLLKVNEGQAALMAGLNSKIDGMNSTFEKLVYEQRQANRLAV